MTTKKRDEAVYTVKGVKSFVTHDGYAYSATLLRDGKAVAEIRNDGNGGPTAIDWKDTRSVEVPWTNYEGKPVTLTCSPEEARLYEHTRGMVWPNWTLPGKPPPYDPESLASELVETEIAMKSVLRKCARSTVFQLKTQKPGEYFTMNAKFGPAIRAELVAKYGDDLENVVNETRTLRL